MSQKSLDVVVVGNVGIDTNVYISGQDIDFSVESHFTENIDCIGQAGGYTSRSYSRLGKRTAFIGYVGDDFSGSYIREEFVADGIDSEALFIDPQGTSRSINFMYRDGRRKNFYDGKSHMQLRPDLTICMPILARAKLAHFHIPNWARYLLPIAQKLGIVIACDLQDAISLDDPYRRDFIEYAEVLFFSAVNQIDPAAQVDQLVKREKCRIAIATLGPRGCIVGTRDGRTVFPSVEMDEPVIDTNGAGDTLAAVFMASLFLDGYDIEDSILRAQIAARYTCTQKACSSQLITAERLDHLFLAQKI